MESEGQVCCVNEGDKNAPNKDDFIPIITEKEIIYEYPNVNIKFIENNSLNLNESDYFEHFEPSFLDYNSIDNIKDDLFKNDLKYDISLYNNLSQSQIFYLEPKKSSSLTIPEFKYNRLFLM